MRQISDRYTRRTQQSRSAPVLRVMGLELENLLLKKAMWILVAAYLVVVLVICISDYLRQSYFNVMESVPVMLMNFVAPAFLVMILISTLAPVFAGDLEQNVYQIPAACLTGRRGRSIAKILAAVFFSILACLIIGTVTFVVSCSCRVFDGDLQMESIGGEREFDPVWTAWRHFGFSLVCLTVACIILALFILFVSCNVKTTITAVSISSIFVIFEYLIHRFSFPTLVQEYNIWVFFEPYYFFVMGMFHFSPFMNLLLLCAVFLPPCILDVWWVIRKSD